MSNTIALIAHDSKKAELAQLLQQYKSTLARFRLLATENTGKQLMAKTDLHIDVVAPGEQGGDLQIAAQVVEGKIAGVVFLTDSLKAQPHEPSMASIWRACEIHNIPFATNLATAELAIRAVAKTRVGHLIFNPVAGQGNPDVELTLIRQILDPAVHLNIIFTQPDLDPAQQAQEAIAQITASGTENNADFIIASGGDGTVSAIASATIGSGVPLGVIPRGTANAFAVALGIPTSLRQACETIAGGNTKQVDAAQCNGLPMVLLAGIGFEAGMVEKADREMKNRLGPLAYVLSGAIQMFSQEPFEAVVEMGDRTLELDVSAITVANAAPPTSLSAQGMGEVIPDDGLLDVTISTGAGGLKSLNTMAGLMASAIVKTQLDSEDVVCLRTDRIRITTNPPQKLAIDGEIIEANPVEFRCLPKGLTVLAPLSTV